MSAAINAADMEVAALLELPLNAPVAEVVRMFKDDKGTLIYVTHAAYRGDSIRLEMDLQPAPARTARPGGRGSKKLPAAGFEQQSGRPRPRLAGRSVRSRATGRR